MRLQDPFWKTFRVYDLPDIAFDQRVKFLQVLESYLGLEITPEAKMELARGSDGTFSGLIVPFLRDRSKKRIELKEVLGYKCIYPQNWEQSVYRPSIEPEPYRRSVLAALSILRQASMTPYEFIVVELAARLSSEELLWWRKLQVKRALNELRDWIELADGKVRCSEAYYAQKGDLSDAKDKLLATVFALIRRRKYVLQLRPSLYEMMDILLFDLEDPIAAVRINQ